MNNDLLYKRGLEKLTNKKEQLLDIVENDLKKVSETIISTKERSGATEEKIREEMAFLAKFSQEVSEKIKKIKDLTFEIKILTNGLLELKTKTGEKVDLGEDIQGILNAETIFTQKAREVYKRMDTLYGEIERKEEEEKEKIKEKYLQKRQTKKGEEKVQETLLKLKTSDETRKVLGKEIESILEKANEEERVELELLLVEVFSMLSREELVTYGRQLVNFKGVPEFFGSNSAIFNMFSSAAKMHGK